MDLRDEARAGNHSFSVTAQRQPEQDDRPASLVVEFTGADDDGQVMVEGAVHVAVDALDDTAQVLGRTLDGLSGLHGMRRKVRRAAAATAPNAGKPWTDELNGQLREHWLARGPGVPATELIGELAREFGRTRPSVRAQIARCGCDPDVPGRLLPDDPDP